LATKLSFFLEKLKKSFEDCKKLFSSMPLWKAKSNCIISHPSFGQKVCNLKKLSKESVDNQQVEVQEKVFQQEFKYNENAFHCKLWIFSTSKL